MTTDEITFNIAIMVVGAILGLILTKITDAYELPTISKTRRRAITGTWSGTYYQKKNATREEAIIQIACCIDPGYRKIKGKMVVRDGRDFTFSIEGGFYHDRFVRLTYTPAGGNSDAIDFGACFMTLSDIPDQMNGLLTGWGSLSHVFVTGEVKLFKTSSKVDSDLSAELSKILEKH